MCGYVEGIQNGKEDWYVRLEGVREDKGDSMGTVIVGEI